jgi:monoamine oxidase
MTMGTDDSGATYEPPARGRGLTRRTFVGAAAATAAAAAVPGAALARKPKRKSTGISADRTADVVIVGGGLSGITAADELIKAGHSAIVLEARDRVGGRTWSVPIPGAPQWSFERGGEALLQLQNQTAIVNLAKEVGIAPYQRNDHGNNQYFHNGQHYTWNRDWPLGRTPPDAAALPDLAVAFEKIDQMQRSIPLEQPWTAPNAEQWDSQTFETWKLANTTNADSRALLDVLIRTTLGVEPRDVSLLWMLASLARWNVTPPFGRTKLQQLIETWGAYRFPQGVQNISVRLAERLGFDRRVFLNSPVRQIHQTASEVTAVSDRLNVTAKLAIVATPPCLNAGIMWDPPLTPQRAQLLQRFPQASIIKMHAIYPTAFWKDEGFTGEVISWDGPITFAGSGTPPDGKPGVMVGFVTAHQSRKWIEAPAEQRKQAFLQNLVQYFGPKAASPYAYDEEAWADEEWTRGGFAGLTTPGVLLDYGPAIREPFGRVHWGGTETAIEWTGSMEGAVRRGLEISKEVMAAL